MTVILKALEATLSQIVNSAKYISMDTENRVKSLMLRLLQPLQVLLLESSLGVKALVMERIPETEKGNALFFKAGVGYGYLLPYSSLGYEDLDTEPEEKKDCYSEDTMGVSHTHNLAFQRGPSIVFKSLTVKKRMLIKNRVSYKF